MIRIDCDFPNLPGHLDWRRKAEVARCSILSPHPAGKKRAFQQKVWKEYKQRFLLAINAGKCMYCEGKYLAGTHDAAEHFRPKAEVTVGRKRIEHPGYYWLAYEWFNLLLSCDHCNGPHDNGREKHPGKHNEFPLSSAYRVEFPGPQPHKWRDVLSREKPLLLHPYSDNPLEHFSADKEGFLRGLTNRGKATIDICDLNRAALVEKRIEAEKNAAREFFLSYVMLAVKGGNVPFGPEVEFSTYLNLRLWERLEDLAAWSREVKSRLKKKKDRP